MLGNERYYNLTMQLIEKSIASRQEIEGPLTEDDRSKLLESIAFTERLFPKVVLSLCRAVHKQMTYVSETSESILGLSSEYLRTLSPGGFVKLIHLEDIKGFKDCLEYVLTKKIDLRQDYRIQFYYRIVNNRGETIYVEDEWVALRNEKGRYVHLSLLKNLTFDESFGGTKVKIYKRIKDRYLLLHEHLTETEVSDLTSRQRDIIQLILMGLSNQEIADRLTLSVFTVKNHKQILFRKLGIGTSLELTSLIKGVNKNSFSSLFGSVA